MLRSLVVVLFALAVVVGATTVAGASGVAASSGVVGAETTNPSEATPSETTTTPDEGPDGHADDPFPSWLPLLLVGGLIVGIAAVGGTLWFVFARVRRFLGQQ